jgi:3-isopropylmalate/(R)-2-methylmalate dehydratase large subunit
MTLVERILARASGRKKVEPGEIVVADVDRLVMHDFSTYLTARVFEERVKLPVANPKGVIAVFDHTFSPANEHDAEVLKFNREWVRRHKAILLDCGSGNIHCATAWNGFIGPGMVVVGSDSHTPAYGTMGAFAAALGNDSHAGTVLPYSKAWFRVPSTIRLELSGELQPGVTPRDIALWLVGRIGEGGAIYKALEFGGPFIDSLDVFDRWLFPLITVDVGAKCAYMEPDEKIFAFVKKVGAADRWRELAQYPSVARERDYEDVWEFDVSRVEPQIACPPTVGNVRPVAEVSGLPIQYAELGGHCGGRLEDLRIAAQVLSQRPKHPDILFNIVPSSRQVMSDAISEGLVEVLHNAGATLFPPSTGSNQAHNMGAMAAGERMLSTQSRNFPGRNGSVQAEMYLASALTVAASATAGRIVNPNEVL